MDFGVFDRMTKRFSTGLGRRSALLAATGLAAVPFVAAAQSDDELGAAARRQARRGPRGKRGKRGKTGPPAGANLVVVTKECPNSTAGVGETQGCVAECQEGFVATGGGVVVGDVLGTLAVLRGSAPVLDGTTPVGWEGIIEFLQIGQEINFRTYAICAPAS